MFDHRRAAIEGLILGIAPSAMAYPSRDIAQLPCADVAQATIARQRWAPGGRPYGLSYEKWTEREFNALRTRIAACSRDSGLQRYVGHLSLQQQIQTGRPTGSEVQEQAIAQELSRKISALPYSASAFDELTALCRQIRQTALPDGPKYSLLGECNNKLESVKFKKRDEDEANAERLGKIELDRFVAEINAMPPTPETLRDLQNLLKNNNYRRPQLSFSQQNTLYQFIGSKIGRLERQALDQRCAAVVQKINVPTELDGAQIDDPVEPYSLTRFLCGAILTTGKVSVRPGGDGDRYEISINDVILVFELGRLLPQQRAFIGLRSPLPGGVKALSLREVRGPKGNMPFDRYLITNLEAQFAPALSAFFAQNPIRPIH